MLIAVSSQVVGPITEKLKEKKKSVSDALAKTLDAVFITVSFTHAEKI